MENPELQVASVLYIIEAMTIQKISADRMSPCFLPFNISMDLEIPISVFIYAFDPSYVLLSRFMYFLIYTCLF